MTERCDTRDMILIRFRMLYWAILFVLSAGFLVSKTVEAKTVEAKEAENAAQPFPAYIDLSGKAGSSRHLGEANIFFPLVQDPYDLIFLNLRGQIDNKESREFNIGLGKRHLFGNYILGGYGFFDVRTSKNDNQFYQSTFGGEFLSENFDFRANGYIPFTREKPTPPRNVKVIERPDLLTIQFSNREHALYGFDGEIGFSLNRLLGHDLKTSPPGNSLVDLRLYVGGYHFLGNSKKGVPNISGPRGRLELSLFKNEGEDFIPPGTELTLGVEGQYDHPRGEQVFGLFRLRIPLYKGSRKQFYRNPLRRRMTAPVVRDIDIVTADAVISEPALLPGASQPIRGIKGVNDAASLFRATTTGQADEIIVLENNIQTSLFNIMQPGQVLTSGGKRIRLRTPGGVEIDYTLPGGDGQDKIITQLSQNIAPVTLSPTSQVSGIQTVSVLPGGGEKRNAALFKTFSSSDWITRSADEPIGVAVAISPDGQSVKYGVKEAKCTDRNGTESQCTNHFSIDPDTGVVYAALPIDYYAELTISAKSPSGPPGLERVLVLSQTRLGQSQNTLQPGGALPNQEKQNGVNLYYGNNFKCTDDEGLYDDNANRCDPPGVAGNPSKIDIVKQILEALLRHDNTNKNGQIQRFLEQNKPTLTLFNTPEELEDNEAFLGTLGNTQDLQASETFVNAHNNSGLNQSNSRRNAAVEEITHLVHNYGIAYAYPELQFRLDQLTQEAVDQGGRLRFTDQMNSNGDPEPDGINDDDSELPREDLDDEYFADGVEAYFNLRGSSGFVLPGSLCSSGGLFQQTSCSALGRTSRDDLRDHHRGLYDLIEEIFGPRETLF